jgi:O-antigen ligase
MAFSIKNLPSNFTLADAGLSWILFFSIVYQKLVPIGFGLLFISLFFNRNSLSKSGVFTFFLKGPALWFILYYLLLIIGLVWTNNLPFALTKLENKLSFVLLPILLFFTVRKWNNAEWKQLLIYALFFALVMYEILAFWRFIVQTENSWQFEFLSSRFSIFMHRSYFACYLVIGIILLFENIRSAFSISTLALICFYSVGVFQTESKAGIVCLFLVFVFQFFSFLRSQNKKFIWLITSSTLFLFSTVLITNNPIKTRFQATWNAMGNIQTKNNNSIESNSARIIMWNTSVEVWKDNFLFGTGTGDYDDELTKMNLKYKNQGVAEERLNSHNQFLNTGVQLGLIGFFILTMIFLMSYVTSDKRLWQLLILLVFFINFLVESFLETQAGIILFCTFLLLFYSLKKDEKIPITN